MQINAEMLLVDLPSSSDSKCKLSFWLNKEVSSGLGLSLGISDISLGTCVLLVVLFSIGSNGLSLVSSFLLLLISPVLELLEQLGVSGLLLLNAFGDNSKGSTSFKIYLGILIA